MFQKNAEINVHFSPCEKEILRQKYHLPKLAEPKLTQRLVDKIRNEAARSEGVTASRLSVVKKGTF